MPGIGRAASVQDRRSAEPWQGQAPASMRVACRLDRSVTSCTAVAGRLASEVEALVGRAFVSRTLEDVVLTAGPGDRGTL